MRLLIVMYLYGCMAAPLAKREPHGLKDKITDGFFNVIGFNFRDFMIENPQEQLDRLLISAQQFPPGSQYLFSLLSDYQRSELLAVSNEFQRFQLYQKYDLKNKGLLLAGLTNSDELESILNWEEPNKTSKILSLLDDNHRQMVLRKMSPRLQAKWLFFLHDKKLMSEMSHFTDRQKEILAVEYTKIRTSDGYEYLDHVFVTKSKDFGEFLDFLAGYFTRDQSILVLTTPDPVLYLSRFTPKERQAIINNMKTEEKKWILEELDAHKLKSFPSDFFDSDVKNSYFTEKKEWENLWDKVRFDVAENDRREKLRKEYFDHRKVSSSDSIPIPENPSNVLLNGESFQGNGKPRSHIYYHDAVKTLSHNYGLKIPRELFDLKSLLALEHKLSSSV